MGISLCIRLSLPTHISGPNPTRTTPYPLTHRPAGKGAADAAPPALPPGEAAVARAAIACAAVRLQLALEGSLSGQVDVAAVEGAVAARLVAWLGQLAQAPAVRALVCEELLAPVTPSVAALAGSLAATAGLPAEAAAVACMLQQQREALLGRLVAVLPVPGEPAEGGSGDLSAAAALARRPLPIPGAAAQQLSLLYWQMSAVLPLQASLVEVRGGGAGGWWRAGGWENRGRGGAASSGAVCQR